MSRMKKYSVLILLAAIVIACGCRGRKYDVYLLIGQSNMAGRGYMVPEDTVGSIEGVYLLDTPGNPVPATHPFNQYSSIRKGMAMQQVNPGLGFVTEMKAHTRHKILLVVNAKGGSALDEWMPGTLFHAEAIRRTRQAEQYGKLKGILWHQGCSDSSDSLRDTYMDRLEIMVDALRDSLDAQDIPFIAGELPYWRPASPKFNEMIVTIDRHIPNSACVSAEGCGPRADWHDPHFSREGQLILGRRYAEKMLEMQKR